MPQVSAPLWRHLRNTAYLLLVAVAVGLIVYGWPQLAAIWRDQALTFVGAMVIMVCATVVQAHNFLVFLETPTRLRVRRFAPVWAWSALANYMAPLQAGGIAVRTAWLATRGVGIAESLLATWRQLAVSIWISLLGLAVGLVFTREPAGRWPALLLIVAWGVVLAARKLWLKWLDCATSPAWLVSRKVLLQRAAANISRVGVAGVAVQYVLGTLLLYWVYSRFGASLGIGGALILACLVYASTIVAVLPGNLGITEAIYMLGGHGVGLTVAQAGALAILFRAAHIATSLLVAFSGALLRNKSAGADSE
jgi:hypothetical protein